MATLDNAGTMSGSTAGILDRERIIAAAGFNRWLVPPAALCIHLCIGMAYGFSVFWLPLSRAVGLTAPKVCQDMSIVQELFTTTCDWRVASLGWMYTLFFVVLGVSAALWGGWLERAGPRKAGVVAAFCWAGGLLLGAIGVYTHQLWILWLGSGVIGGVGLGLGYISPVSTLVKWFPDRRGMATGMAIMGFGGGAMIGAPLADLLMNTFKTPTSVGVWETFLAMGVIYFVFMMIGAFRYRLPPSGWRPDGWAPPAENKSMITQHHVHLDNAHKTPQFWLIWWVLCLNVSAGIGVIGMASPMLQEIFAGSLIGLPDLKFNALSAEQKVAIAAIAAGFTGLLSLFNIGGRFFWASLSDHIGRKSTYYTFFLLGIVLYASAPWFAAIGSKALFVLAFGIILSMYGGGFATVPAYLADMFGTQFVGAIHGRLLTAWSTAGIIGPVVVNYIREAQLAAGVPRDQLYNTTMYILCAMLIAGLICNYLIKPVDPKWYMSQEEVSKLQAATKGAASGPSGSFGIGKGGLDGPALLFWAFVGIPLAWGVWITLKNAVKIF
ncbi:OFA family MFS transporter [Bradyrhizobium sp. U87765 SZCCT0131]|uniref:OFA family MFS transporter n=1 Tax=unclassified Bradyrhizobium TaxID=2631580 RepID=UPI001BA5A023|nr:MULTISPECIES: OFA family MFS transporter [unclassified Bradyrhizobium]MBR1220630.1 OFA family MFS transporter [Bradyrhizobium sp. U87765 SZCCT0131]MBR1262916.1 OFA family MFS transporter [Bradyrhizobium sp. U87765 SZCCT0134]MBR1307202.1 OFA family MFS transporter [Bradyrhizobium sp. U87765 SZCCT0110]MBR1322911.1 OFA family MFS transporter [Bradyrhizobium sp. U87765 SZCCT0109]MBR1346156.1 OFA family MFS transporter [Bradyrhizobium sp. U87765 SZCCT0048]